MEINRSHARLAWVVLTAALVFFPAALAQNPPTSPPGPEAALVCSSLEVKTDEATRVTLAVFHQANKSDGPRLGELLKQNDGASVEFETSDGRSHKATLFRLGTCFGRGLLVFPAGSARLSPGDQFRLRFPKATNPSPSP
jgi:hypothetical protein